ncbi:DUF2207 domain-containing protein [Clostridium sp. 19966]|uniref:DUF2207 domain-containing protein n=1 Tax=Clostridium sp. 19966 TaxID=2768166 RepID=UPI0028DEEBDB|nr:DUF2207 domain-containing protein [Clostridium sp. 19966]MDT8719086.1 DUF2207 domain-containing protein [Clostridium sp. 19966]
MKKIRKKTSLFITLLFSVLIIVAASTKAEASSGSYYISDININASVDDMGNMSVNEEYDYVFQGSFNGIKREVKTKGSDGIYDVSAKVMNGQNAETPQFEVNDTDGGKEIKIYSKSDNENKKFLISYKVKNVITKYSDLSELKWIFYENESDVQTNRVTVYLTLPQTIDGSVKYSGEGPKRGLISLDENNKIKLQLNDLGDDDIIGAQVLFPNTWVNTSKIVNMKREDYYAKKKREEIITAVVVVSSILAAIGAIVGLIYARGRKRRRGIEEYRSQYVFYDGRYYSQLPSEMPPELVAMLMNKSVGINELMASILNLSNKGAITFLENGFFERDYKNLAFIINNYPQDNLMESEAFLVNWLREYSRDDLVYLRLIKQNAAKADFANKFSTWKNIVSRETEQLDFYTHIVGKKILTNEYRDEEIKWKAFKAYINDSDYREIINLREKGIWEKVLPYAMVLGVAAQMLESVKYSNTYDNVSYGRNDIFMNYWFLNYYTSIYYMDINRNYNSYMDSSSSSSSNFSGGSGGGFGGGGGSSAF